MRTETLEIACYGLFAGLFGLLVWEGYKTKTSGWAYGPTTTQEWRELRQRLREEGEAKRPDEERLKYTASYKDWWQLIERANWTGKLPAKPVPTEGPAGPTGGDPKAPKTLKPLTEIIELRLIAANGDDENRIKIQYKDPNVEVPESSNARMSGVTPVGGDPVATPTGNAFQDLVAGDTLYPPYATIRFTGVDLNGPAAIFTRPAPEGAGKTVEEKLMLDELKLDQSRIDEKTILEVGGRAGTSERTADSGRQWVDPGDSTKEIEQNVWMISRRDSDVIGEDYGRILEEDIQLRDWQSSRADRSGEKPRGVSVRRISPQLQRFGVKQGDVLIKINGQRVKSKSNAINTARKQYDRGVRTFELTFLSGGREIVRTYTVPKKK